MEKKHSGIGIVSFFLGLVSILGMAGSYYAAASLSPAPEHLGTYSLIGGLVVLFLFSALGGALLGLVGWFQKERSKLFPVLGLLLNCLLVAVFLAVSVIGALSGSPLPGTFN